MTGFALGQLAKIIIKKCDNKKNLEKLLLKNNELTRNRILHHPRQRLLGTRIPCFLSFVQIHRILRRTRQTRSIQMRRT